MVGTINLVEKIAQLAQIPMSDVEKLDADSEDELQRNWRRRIRWLWKQRRCGQCRRPSRRWAKSRSSRKGSANTSSTPSKAPRRSPTAGASGCARFEAKAVPFKIQYRYRPQEYGEQLVRMYLLTNDKESKLGTTPLPDGIVRVFRDNGRGGLSLSHRTDDQVHPDRRQDRAEPRPRSRTCIFELIKLRASATTSGCKSTAPTFSGKSAAPGVQIEVNSSVAGWDDHEVYTQRIRNYTAKPIEVEVRRSFAGHVVFRSQLKPIAYDYQTPEFTATVEAGKKADFPFEIVRRQGRNAKQNRVTIEEGASRSELVNLKLEHLRHPTVKETMKLTLNIAVLTFLLAAAPFCFALREIAPLTAAEAKAMGIEVRAKAAGPDAVWLELEFKPDGKLEDLPMSN